MDLHVVGDLRCGPLLESIQYKGTSIPYGQLAQSALQHEELIFCLRSLLGRGGIDLHLGNQALVQSRARELLPRAIDGDVGRRLEQIGAQVADGPGLPELQQAGIGLLGNILGILDGTDSSPQEGLQRAIVLGKERRQRRRPARGLGRGRTGFVSRIGIRQSWSISQAPPPVASLGG
jgi:hypothetical protein